MGPLVRQRTEVVLCGGRPWGFSIKGGKESNKPLVISKIESGGKAESGGLYIGDIIFSINNVPLTGLRNEAIQLVKTSGYTLVLEVERGLMQRIQRRPSPTSRDHVPHDCTPTSMSQQQPPQQQQQQQQHATSYWERATSSPTRHHDHYSGDARGDSPTAQPPYPARLEAPGAATQQQPHHLRGGGSPSTQRRQIGGGGSPSHQLRGGSPSGQQMRGNSPQHHVIEQQQQHAPQPIKVRMRRAREKGVTQERPRSWHASKHPDLDPISPNHVMRSPPQSYVMSHQVKRHRLKTGWNDSGDLKSPLTGSRDSLISNHSRLSVSSGRSSSAMSSSRGSLDNLDQVPSTRKQQHPSLKIGAGIVNKNKHMFERLSSTDDITGSREDVMTSSQRRRSSTDDGDSPAHRRPSPQPVKQLHHPQQHKAGPEPPTRDASSAEAVKHYAHRLSDGDGVKMMDQQKRHESAAEAVDDQRRAFYKAIEKNVDVTAASASSAGKSERVFGLVTSTTGNRNVVSMRHSDVASPVTSSSQQQQQTSPARYEQLKECYTPFESHAVGLVHQPERAPPEAAMTSSTTRVDVNPAEMMTSSASRHQHSKSGSGDSTDSQGKGRGKYGAVWMTPAHAKSQSADLGDVPHSQSAPSFANVSESNGAARPRPGAHGRDSAVVHQRSDPTVLSRDAARSRADAMMTSQPEGGGGERSIMQSLQNSQQRREVRRNNNNGDYEMMWKSFAGAPPPLRSPPQQQAPPPEPADSADHQRAHHHKPANIQLSVSSWADTGDLDDDAFTPPPHDQYCNDIKDMSSKVLRLTSLRRKDLSPPQTLSFQEKQRKFCFPQQQQQPAATSVTPRPNHPRSRSHGNELDEIAETKRVSGAVAERQPRPKSAGMTSSTNVIKHRTSLRATPVSSPANSRNLHPSSSTPAFYKTRKKADSLPRNIRSSSSGGGGGSGGGSEKLSAAASAAQNRRISIDVRPELKSRDHAIPKNIRDILLERQKPASDSGSGTTSPISQMTSPINPATSPPNQMTSPTPNSVTSPPNNAPSPMNQTTSSPPGGENTDARSESPYSTPPCRRDNRHHHDNHRPHRHQAQHNSVRKIPNFNQTRAKFNSTASTAVERRKSSANILHIAQQSAAADVTRRELGSRGRASSLDNLVDRSSSPPSDVIDTSADDVINADDVGSNAELDVAEKSKVKAPPRRNRSHRHSNSSTTSSATTMSTLSSLSSTSSTSIPAIPTFPPVGEEDEDNADVITTADKRDAETTAPEEDDVIIPPPTTTSDPSGETADSNKSSEAAPTRPCRDFNSNTFVVDRRRKKKPRHDVIDDVTHERMMEDEIAQLATALPCPPPPATGGSSEQAEKVAAIVEKVTRQASFRTSQVQIQPPPPPPPPPGKPLGEVGERLLRRISMKRTQPAADRSSSNTTNSCDEVIEESSEPPQHESSQPTAPCKVDKESKIKINSLLPDLSLSSSLLSEHPPDLLAADIIKSDKSLAQVFTSNPKQALDYMTGILSQPSHDIIEEGMRRRQRHTNTTTAVNGNNDLPSDATTTPEVTNEQLPASSNYYKTSASKARILNLAKEKLAEGDSTIDTVEEINRKKMELVVSIGTKLDELGEMKGLLVVERDENEQLGTQVRQLAKQVCTSREFDKYLVFVEEVDKIINLLLSLSGRLARVENTMLMIESQAGQAEVALLKEKKRKLIEQHNEAKTLKEGIDKKQKLISETFAGYFNREQFADYEHYIKMKSALIVEQRELDDKAKLGEEQMQCLKDSLPDQWQNKIDLIFDANS